MVAVGGALATSSGAAVGDPTQGGAALSPAASSAQGQLFAEAFPELLDELEADLPLPPVGAHLIDGHTAIVNPPGPAEVTLAEMAEIEGAASLDEAKAALEEAMLTVAADDETPPSLLYSSLPLRDHDPDGEVTPLELDLEREQNGFQPVNALGDARFPASGDGAFRVRPDNGNDADEIAVTLRGAASAGGERVGEKAVIYPGVGDAADLIAAVKPLGIELLIQLRSAQAAEEYVFDFDLPAGAELRAGDQQVEVVRDGEALATIPAPTSLDADGEEVETTTSVDGDALVVVVHHRAEGSVTYPALMDPDVVPVQIYSWWNGDSLNFFGWGPYQIGTNPQPNAGIYSLSGNCNGALHGGLNPPCHGPGLYIYASPGNYIGATQAGYVYSVPHLTGPNGIAVDNGQTTTFITTARVNQQDFSRRTDVTTYPRLRYGIWAPTLGNWLVTPPHEDFDGITSPGTATITTGPANPTRHLAKQFRYELYHPPGGTPTSAYRHAHLGSISFDLYDEDNPQVQLQSLPSELWIDDRGTSGDRSVTANFYDGPPRAAPAPGQPEVGPWGLGIAKTYFFDFDSGLPGSAPDCVGTNYSPCPQVIRNRSFSYNTHDYGEGANIVGLNAYDATGRSASPAATWGVLLDHSPPTLQLSRDLQPDSPDHSGADRYQLEVTARDGEPSFTDLSLRESGVRTVTVKIDGVTVVGPGAANCADPSLGSCSRTHVITLTAAQQARLARVGLEIEVTATDQIYDPASPNADRHIVTRRWIADEGGAHPVVERLVHEVYPTDAGGLRKPGERVDLERWNGDADVVTDAFARDLPNADGVGRLELYLPNGNTQTRPTDCAGGCPKYAGRTFEYQTDNQPEGSHVAAVRAFRPGGGGVVSRPQRFRLNVDRTAPVVTGFSAQNVSPVAPNPKAFDLTVTATDGNPADLSDAGVRAGVRKVEVFVGGVKRFSYVQACPQGSCPVEKHFRYKPGRELIAAQGQLTAVVTDQAGNASAPRPLQLLDAVEVPNFGGDPAELGLEDYFHYDSVEAGAGGTVHTNLATGNVVWHKVPVVNPGRGLSSVVNVTYNSYDYSLSELFTGTGAVSSLLGSLDIGYDQAGPGFSLGISGLTRVNEPLRGLFTAQPNTSPQQVANPNAVFMTDPDGTEHRFDQIASGVWEAPAGVDLHMRRYSTSYIEAYSPGAKGGTQNTAQNQARSIAITRPDGVTYFFDGLGMARSIEDRNGNVIKFIYKLINPTNGQRCDEASDPNDTGMVIPGLCEPRLTQVIDPGGNDLPAPAPASRMLQVDYFDGPGDGATPSSANWLKVESITDHDGRPLKFAYNNDGRLISLTEAAGTPDQRVTSFTYALPTGLSAPAYHAQLATIADPVVETPVDKVTTIDYAPVPTLPTTEITAILNVLLGGLNLNELSADLFDRKATGVRSRNGNLRTYGVGVPTSTGAVTSTLTDARSVPSTYRFDETKRLLEMTECVEVVPADCAGGTPDRRVTALEWSQDGRVERLAEGLAPGAPPTETPETAITHFAYNDNGALTGLIDPLGRTTVLTYRDGPGTLISQQGLDSGRTFVSDLLAIRRPSGRQWTFGVDTRGNVTSEADPLGNSTTFVYDAADHFLLRSETDPEGNQTTYPSYDKNGLPTEVIDPRGNAPSGTPSKQRWLYRYDDAGNLRQSVDPRGADDLPAGPLSGALAQTNPYTTTLTYDKLDRLTTERIPKCSDTADPPGPDVARCTQAQFIDRLYTYDKNGNVRSERDGANALSEFVYTPMDRLASETHRGELASGTTRTELTTYGYDAEEGLTEVVSPRGTASGTAGDFTTKFVLDALGRRVASLAQAGTGAGDGRLITSYAYDRRDNVVAVIDPNRNANLAGTPDAAARQAALDAADPAKVKRVTYEYDDANQLVAEVEDPAQRALRREYTYDANGNVLEEITPRGFAADPTDPADTATVYGYDERDLLVSVTNPVGSQTNLVYDKAGRLVSEERPNGAASDTEGDFTVNYAYDAAGEVTIRSIPLAEGQYGLSGNDGELDDLRVTYERDQVGNPLAITDGRGKRFTNTFLDTGELLSTTRASWWSLDWGASRGLPAAGRRFGQTASGATPDLAVPIGGPALVERGGSGAAMGERIGPEERLPGPGAGDFGAVGPQAMAAFLPRAGKATFDYDGELRLTRVGDQAGFAREIAYDPQGRITRKVMPYLDASKPTLTHSYVYDPNGNLEVYTDGEGSAIPLSNPTGRAVFETRFTYDAFDRPKQEDAPGSLSTKGDAAADRELTDLVYDANGNVLSRLTPRTVSGPGRLSFSFAYDTLDRLERETNPAAERFLYSYDANSNVADRDDAAEQPDVLRLRRRRSPDPGDRGRRLRRRADDQLRLRRQRQHDAHPGAGRRERQ